MCALLFSVTMVKAQELRWGITGSLSLSSPINYNSQVGYNRHGFFFHFANQLRYANISFKDRFDFLDYILIPFIEVNQ